MGNNNGRTVYRNCTDCGDEFIISVEFQSILAENKMRLPKRCKKCRDIRRVQMKSCECIICGNTFEITVSESKFYKERRLQEPKRCEKCRRSKHGKKNAETDQ